MIYYYKPYIRIGWFNTAALLQQCLFLLTLPIQQFVGKKSTLPHSLRNQTDEISDNV